MAGRDQEYLDAIGSTLTGLDEPTARTAHSRTRTVENDLFSGAGKGQEPWREHSLARGCESVLSAPILNEERLFGVFSVYASAPGAFDEFTEQVFEDVGDAVAHGLEAFELKRALMADPSPTSISNSLPSQTSSVVWPGLSAQQWNWRGCPPGRVAAGVPSGVGSGRRRERSDGNVRSHPMRRK